MTKWKGVGKCGMGWGGVGLSGIEFGCLLIAKSRFNCSKKTHFACGWMRLFFMQGYRAFKMETERLTRHFVGFIVS